MGADDRIAVLEAMARRNELDPRPRFGLAAEHEKRGEWKKVVEHLTAYLRLTDDQGNAWGRLGRALRQLQRTDEAIAAYEKGIAAAQRNNHPSMAEEFEEILEQLR